MTSDSLTAVAPTNKAITTTTKPTPYLFQTVSLDPRTQKVTALVEHQLDKLSEPS